MAAVGAVRGHAERLVANRSENPIVDIGLSTLERDQARGAPLLAGALAYRLFFWLLPFTLVLVAGLGFLAHADSTTPTDITESIGVVGFAATSITAAGAQAEHSRWWALGIGLFGLYFASVSFLKSLTLTAALLWGVPARKLRRKPVAALAMSGLVVAVLLLLGLEAKLRDRFPVFAFPSTFVFMIVVAGIWLLVSHYLPRAQGTGWLHLVPGALLFAVGIQGVHLATVYFVSRKFESASSTYGALGAATAMLLTLFLMGRVIVLAIELNAVLWERRTLGRIYEQAEGVLGNMAVEMRRGLDVVAGRVLGAVGRERHGPGRPTVRPPPSAPPPDDEARERDGRDTAEPATDESKASPRDHDPL